jgi:starch synthase
MRIVFATAEVSPFAKTGGLGDVCGSLPKALAHAGHDVALFCPFYRAVRRWYGNNGLQPDLVTSGILKWGDWEQPWALYKGTLPGNGVPIYFIANDEFFDRPGIYDAGPAGDDHLERYTFFSRAVVAACEFLAVPIDILHAHDWHTAILPVYLETGLRESPVFAGAASVFTIHNLNYVGRYSADRFPVLGVSPALFHHASLEYFGDLHLMKGGVVFANRITTVSPTYAREIQTAEFGAGIDSIIRDQQHKLTGILNGIDLEYWDPGTDPLLPKNYSAGNLAGKRACKRALQKEAGLAIKPKQPLIGMVSRLVGQKGVELVTAEVSQIVGCDSQLVILGTGEEHYEQLLASIEADYPGSYKFWRLFDERLAHLIFAGSDIFLVPSLYEPCGLNQMYALKYGSVPVVRRTGGLADTVIAFDGCNLDGANGFDFVEPRPQDLYYTTRIASLTYRQQTHWPALMRNGMLADFSWETSAGAYEDVYRDALRR